MWNESWIQIFIKKFEKIEEYSNNLITIIQKKKNNIYSKNSHKPFKCLISWDKNEPKNCPSNWYRNWHFIYRKEANEILILIVFIAKNE